MQSFLYLTAKDLYRRFGNNLSDVAVVFPNHRARLFFSKHLYQIAGKPLWSPVFLTIQDLFVQQSECSICEGPDLIRILFETHAQHCVHAESFDEFYQWGEVLLSDFDDVDKNMVPANQLFRNIHDFGTYTDTLEHLNEDQIASIQLFFKNFDPDRKTELKRRFLENWNILIEVYAQYKQALLEQKKAYEGMVFREVAEKVQQEGVAGFAHQHYVFVGFNVLNECEKALFKCLQSAGKALFYWDYDVHYMQSDTFEAGRFMRQNLRHFPNALEESHFHSLIDLPKKFQFVSTSTENAGARYLPKWIKELQETVSFKPEETAVVLCNEGLLLPVLHSIPDDIQDLNVTMGFPLQQTAVCSLINHLSALHSDGYIDGKTPAFNHRYVLPVLQHPLIRQAAPEAETLELNLRASNTFRPSVSELKQGGLLSEIFEPTTNPKDFAKTLLCVLSMLGKQTALTESTHAYDPLHAEALFRCHNIVTNLSDMLSEHMEDLQMGTFRKLLFQILNGTTVPFSGEPVKGLQIMGLLETRNLDFKNMLLLSVNEGVLPKNGNSVSFIPYNLRKAYGMTTMEHSDSIYAYYFFRLLQRAEQVCMVYNSATEGQNKGEMSRFMLQLKLETPYKPELFNLTSEIELASTRHIQIEKSDEIMAALHQRYNVQANPDAKILSPTALNAFQDCSLRFYFQYLAHLKPNEEMTDEVDGAMLGNFFHHSAEFIYASILLKKNGKSHQAQDVLQALSSDEIRLLFSNKEAINTILKSDLEPWIQGIDPITHVVDLFFKLDFFKKAYHERNPEYNGEQLVRRNLVAGFVKTLLQRDAANTPFQLVGMETFVKKQVTISDSIEVHIGGNIDRIDIKEGLLKLIDYKTGGKPSKVKNLAALFSSGADRPKHLFQVLTYASMLQEKWPDMSIKPELLYINLAENVDFTSDIEFVTETKPEILERFQLLEPDFSIHLNQLISNIFDSKSAFCQTAFAENCTYCDYKNLCRRSDTTK